MNITIDHPRKYQNIRQCSLFFTPKFCISFVFISFSWELKWSQEKLKTMLMLNFGVTNKEHYGMLWYFLEWSISITPRFKQGEPDDGQKLGLILVQRGNETWNCFSMRVLLLSWRFCFLSRYLTVLLGKVMYTGQNRSETSQKHRNKNF